MSNIQALEKEFREYVKKIEDFNEALSVLAWDSRIGAPKKGVQQRSEIIGTLSTEVFQLSTSNQMSNFIEKLTEKDVYKQLSIITQKTVDECKKKYERNVKIPKEEYKQYVMLQAESESIWEEAKDQADFDMFRPYLEKLLEFKKKFIHYWGYNEHPYNTLLDDYEPGIFVDTIDHVFSELRDGLIPLVKGVSESPHQPQTDFIYQPFSKEQQKHLNIDILNEMGYDFSKGRLDETVHPFAIGINPNDVRITTKYKEDDFKLALFGTIHEGGHALYEQNISEELIGTPLCDGTSMGIHESQSLFWEKFIGKHYSFWERNYQVLKKHSNGQFDDVSLEQFYFAINEAKPSLIRIESDELTYCLHIILRYELEKSLIEGSLDVKDLPEAWNEKMKEYLGVVPNHNGEGVLQDVHWSFGAFGYFPSYALGYIYAAQIKEAIVRDLPQFDQYISQGDYTLIHEWLKKHIHQHGAMKKPAEIIKDITGNGINAKPLLSYLNEKYRRLYQF
ncbi:carboxypeptidase M32 [Halalkalibacter hemicellulosilyticus]|uniref:Metal-dependent carboxypeptidase n=1 Tax=Halalkalibacter hemicellulosilyticusJCM 9152 TaxID=1236971 RepID=W4QFW3_9BACI|nr:carboxypeptidase M32 [Halalkalibacter hemicellulosilyticus]GAE30538.1 thermostable carboxypeptidase 1 [Halalkalibacter hemicellulosilyticusJCM 9152]